MLADQFGVTRVIAHKSPATGNDSTEQWFTYGMQVDQINRSSELDRQVLNELHSFVDGNRPARIDCDIKIAV
jgi:hypothetical protein